MSKQFKVAVVGATGAVGETMLSILAERKFPASEVIALASERSAGGYVQFGNDEIMVRDLATFDPAGVDIALFSAGGSISKEYGPKFAAAGAVVIDNSSAFRYDDDVPLVVSEVNPEQVKQRPRGIIANPNCSTMQMLVALGPIHRKAGIERINVATYQSVSGAGRSGLEELGKQTAALLNFQDFAGKESVGRPQRRDLIGRVHFDALGERLGEVELQFAAELPRFEHLDVNGLDAVAERTGGGVAAASERTGEQGD